ncbi:MAG: DUF4258 domain-containing protein [Moorellales bacterium]
MDIESIREKIAKGQYRMTAHALTRFKERGITAADMEAAIMDGEIIEEYPNDYPFPSCLIYGRTGDGRPLHVVISLAPVSHVITVYSPDEKKWVGHKVRRREGKEQ